MPTTRCQRTFAARAVLCFAAPTPQRTPPCQTPKRRPAARSPPLWTSAAARRLLIALAATVTLLVALDQFTKPASDEVAPSVSRVDQAQQMARLRRAVEALSNTPPLAEVDTAASAEAALRSIGKTAPLMRLTVSAVPGWDEALTAAGVAPRQHGSALRHGGPPVRRAGAALT